MCQTARRHIKHVRDLDIQYTEDFRFKIAILELNTGMNARSLQAKCLLNLAVCIR